MTNSNYPARPQGATISRKLYYEDFGRVRDVVRQLQDRGVFRSTSPVDVDEQGSFVVITYLDPTIVSTGRASAPSTTVARMQPQRVLATQRPLPVTKPVYKRWWFSLITVLGFLATMCLAGYWALQQLKQLSAPSIGAGVVGFLFVVVLVVAIVRKLAAGDVKKSHGGGDGRYGFHYTPCD